MRRTSKHPRCGANGRYCGTGWFCAVAAGVLVNAGLLVDRTDHPTTALWCSAAFTTAAVGVAVIGQRRRGTSPVEQVRADAR